MHVHVFAIDILPSDRVVSTGGGLRSLQVISGLRNQGFDVSYSVPSMTSLAKANWDNLTPSERKNSFSWDIGKTYEDVLMRLKPDVVVCLWPSVYSFPRFRNEGPIIVYDLNGFQNVEAVQAQVASGGAVISFKTQTKQYLNKILSADLLLCGSTEQKAYWSGLLSMHLNSFMAPDMIRLPYSPAVEPKNKSYSVGAPSFFCTGAFLPWNSPEGHLSACASILKNIGKGELTVIGRPDPSMMHAQKVDAELKSISGFDFVNVVSGMPYNQLSEMINCTGIAIDLNSASVEREFAVPIRTVTYLAHGVPIITNNYSAMGREVALYDAGWAIDPIDSQKFGEIIREILHEDPEKISQKSKNARKLIADRFSPNEGFGNLKNEIITRKDKRQVRARVQERRMPASADTRPCVLVISDDFENFLELRIRIPFDAMYKKGLIKGYHILHKNEIIRSVGVKQDINLIDAVWVQRAPISNPMFITDFFNGQFVYDIDDNLLVSPSYRPAFGSEWCRLIRSLLSGSAAITTTSNRLTSSLQRHSGIQIEHKTFIAPNLTEAVDPLPGRTRPDALLLASSDHLPLTKSLESFVASIKKFTSARAIPIFYVGSPVNNLSKYGMSARATGTLSYQTYREYLRQGNFMAVAPLEGSGDARTHEFITSKSDIKMVEFGSVGLPAVYADVAPYRETPLTCGPLTNMGDSEALFDALDRVYKDPDHWRLASSQSVIEHRLASVNVESSWFQAIQKARLKIPIDIELLREKAIRFAQFRRERPISEELFNESDYIAVNESAVTHIGGAKGAVYRHYATEGVKNGLSWFPGSVPNAQEMMSKVREEIINEDASLNELAARVDRAIAKIVGIRTSSAELSACIVTSEQKGVALPATTTKRSFGAFSKLFLRSKSAPPLFDSAFYLERNEDVRLASMDPYTHYINHGFAEGRAPNEFFDVVWYVKNYFQSNRELGDPLEHYIKTGAAQGFDPGPRFSTRDYLMLYPDVERSGMNPLEHYIKIGRSEGRMSKKPSSY